MINPGSLRHQATLQLVTRGQDIAGTADSTTDIGKVWISIKPLQGREINYANTINSDVTTEIKLHYYSGLTPAYRFKYGTRIFNLKSVLNPDEMQMEHVCLCTEVISG